MIGKSYRVQPGHMLTGQHRVYEAGETIPEAELAGDWENSIKRGAIVEIAPAAPAAAKAKAPAMKTPAASKPAPRTSYEILSSLSDEQLAAEAKERGVSVEGGRKELIDRIYLAAGYSADGIPAAETADGLDLDALTEGADATKDADLPPMGTGARRRGRPPKAKEGGTP